MEWLNLHVSVLDSDEVKGSEPIDRATWLMLLRYCAGQENGGVIIECREWADRKWQQLCAVTRAEIERNSILWSWDGDNLVLNHYPAEKEHEVKTNRKNGRKGGRPQKPQHKEKKEDMPSEKPGGFESVNPDETKCFEIAETEGKGKERKGMEGKGKETNREISPELENDAFVFFGSTATASLKEWLVGHDEKTIRAAMARAEQSGIKTTRYVHGILAAWARGEGGPNDRTAKRNNPANPETTARLASATQSNFEGMD